MRNQYDNFMVTNEQAARLEAEQFMRIDTLWDDIHRLAAECIMCCLEYQAPCLSFNQLMKFPPHLARLIPVQRKVFHHAGKTSYSLVYNAGAIHASLTGWGIDIPAELLARGYTNGKNFCIDTIARRLAEETFYATH